MKFKKRGVSPLIATILLISFAVALGAVIMVYGSRHIEQKLEKSCTSVQIEITNACYDYSQKKIILDTINKGGIDIDGLQVMVAGSLFETEIGGPIKKEDPLKTEINYDTSLNGEIKGITVVPILIKRESERDWCMEKKAIKEDIRSC